MTPTQCATLLIRILSVYWLVGSLIIVTEIVYAMYLVTFASSSADVSSQREFLLACYIVRFFIYFGTGTACFLFTKPLARILAKGLDSMKQDATASDDSSLKH
jgi:hypothetical protein